MFGKTENGGLIVAPSRITKNGFVHYHPSAELYAENGYLPVIETPYPEIDEENPKHYASHYEELDGNIVKVWKESELPETEPMLPTVEERLSTVERELSSTMEAVDHLIMGGEAI